MCKCNPNRHADCGCKIKSYNGPGPKWIVRNWCKEHTEQIKNVRDEFREFKKAWIKRIEND